MNLELTLSEKRTLVTIINAEITKSAREGRFWKRYQKLVSIQNKLITGDR